MCGRCYEEVDEVFEANCKEGPEVLKDTPLGQYHCPDCGAMVMSGYKHPGLCKRCLIREHPVFDENKKD